MAGAHKGGQIAHIEHVAAHFAVALQPHLKMRLQRHGNLQGIQRIERHAAAVAKQRLIIADGFGGEIIKLVGFLQNQPFKLGFERAGGEGEGVAH